MPDFYADDISIDPDEYVSACNKREIQELIDVLVEDGHIPKPVGVENVRGNLNDDTFRESLDTLSRCRHMLTVEEEAFINKLGERFKYLG